ncbi:argonaute 5 [Castilleja foliolosa]|uniref:Argonaute 5 n=1 Tax=Castilleja foliolosa TaxID=1961234 RepID=A0ABD3BK72_9LAMI
MDISLSPGFNLTEASSKKVCRVFMKQLDYTFRSSHKIVGISTESTELIMFSLDGSDATISVIQYFLQKYKIVLKYLCLPALQAGSSSKPIYFPMEMVKHNNYNAK